MKIFDTAQIRNWDKYTIEHEPVLSIDLMERAAARCVEWLQQHGYAYRSISIFCGKGNNGGDGLAIARLLASVNHQLKVYVLQTDKEGTTDFEKNHERLQQFPAIPIHFIASEKDFPALPGDEIIIDALLGSGINRKADRLLKELISFINHSCQTIVSIDIPSGLFADTSSKDNTVVKANHTISFQCYKMAFLVAENAPYIGQVHILDIGLHPDFQKELYTNNIMVDASLIQSIYTPRNNFSHKGNFGHALMIAGSYGKMGAAVLAAKASLRSGIGLLTCHVPQCGYAIMQVSVPEAMVLTDVHSSFITKTANDLIKYTSIGIGPGIGTSPETITMLQQAMTNYNRPMVIDADALNCIALQKDLVDVIPAGSVLTPHPKEMERLFGKSANDFERIALVVKKAQQLQLIIVLKGHHTLIATPEGKAYFNSTGNAGMATGGSGDTLTGIISGLLAQGYTPDQAAVLGVYLHGMSGDIAAAKKSMEAMVAGDIIDNLGEAFVSIASQHL